MEYYDILAKGYNELHRNEQVSKLHLIGENLKINKNDMMLDVGCGIGLTSEVFHCRITGLEPSVGMIGEAKKTQKNRNLVQGRAEYLPFKNHVFDCVICVTALHNFQDPKKALEEMKRVNKGKGAISILKKAKRAIKLQALVEEMFEIKKLVHEDKDMIYIFSPKSP
ncbi:MAG: class I SAM-dependent methyltransferase [Thermoplasmata archaeon]|nr:MAG: class I SAM-dependent methyltransferase [Thermoplasmata archaeon]